MPVNRYYSSTAGLMTLSAAVTAGDASFGVDTTVGLPTQYPYTVVVDPGLATEEIVSVTNASGTTLTVTRGQDGTSAQAHGLGAKLRHMISARDLRESREHEAATTGVHGATGAVVGTTDTQSLDNKTFQATATDHTPVTIKAAATQTTPVARIQTNAGVDQVKFLYNGIEWVNATATSMGVYNPDFANVLGVVAHIQPANNIEGLRVTYNAASTAGVGLMVKKGTVNKFTVDINGNTSVAGTLGVTGATTLAALNATTVTASGTVSGATLTSSGAVNTVSVSASGTVTANALVSNANTTVNGNLSTVGTHTASNAVVQGTGAAKQVHWGSGSGTTDANGALVITHGAPFTPSVVYCQSRSSTAVSHSCTATYTLTGTTFTSKWYAISTGSPIATSLVNYQYVAYE